MYGVAGSWLDVFPFCTLDVASFSVAIFIHVVLQVQSAKDQNPLALPWFTSKHISPCSKCEDLWKVAWSAREDFLQDLAKAETGKEYQLVASSGENLRYAIHAHVWTHKSILAARVFFFFGRRRGTGRGGGSQYVGRKQSIFTHLNTLYWKKKCHTKLS